MNNSEESKIMERFIEIASHGFNCREIAGLMGINPKDFGWKMKKILGVYPSVYIARMKNGKT